MKWSNAIINKVLMLHIFISMCISMHKYVLWFFVVQLHCILISVFILFGLSMFRLHVQLHMFFFRSFLSQFLPCTFAITKKNLFIIIIAYKTTYTWFSSVNYILELIWMIDKRDNMLIVLLHTYFFVIIFHSSASCWSLCSCTIKPAIQRWSCLLHCICI